MHITKHAKLRFCERVLNGNNTPENIGDQYIINFFNSKESKPYVAICVRGVMRTVIYNTAKFIFLDTKYAGRLIIKKRHNKDLYSRQCCLKAIGNYQLEYIRCVKKKEYLIIVFEPTFKLLLLIRRSRLKELGFPECLLVEIFANAKHIMNVQFKALLKNKENLAKHGEEKDLSLVKIKNILQIKESVSN